MDSQHLILVLQTPHIHLTRRMTARLFGEGVRLTPVSPTDLPGKFQALEEIRVTGSNGASVLLPVIGPAAAYTQVELNSSLASFLGVEVKRELSGRGTTGGITLEGPAGTVFLEKGVLLPQPHIHMPPEDASTLSLLDGQIITLETEDGRRLDHVAVRVSHQYVNRIHLLPEKDCPFTETDTFHVLPQTRF